MDIIKSYLENMFLGLPHTAEVQKAKNELAQMMEDKYNELIASGSSDNEAVGIVISEFGNLEELAEALGIHEYMGTERIADSKAVSFDQVKQYIGSRISASVKIAIAVFLCITCPVPVIITYSFSSAMNMDEHIATAVGILFLFLFLIVAIGLFIVVGIQSKKWHYIKYEPFHLDFGTESYVQKEMENFRSLYAVLIAVGVILCVACFVPAAVIGALGGENTFLLTLSGAAVLIFIGIGVIFLVIAGVRNNTYRILIGLNGFCSQNMGNDQTAIDSKIRSVYYQTVTCIYLIVSFLTFRWEITWIIWPIASVLRRWIENIILLSAKDHKKGDDLR